MNRLLPPALHTTDRPSSTAQWTALGRALELRRASPIVTDEFAPLFLTRPTRVLHSSLAATGPVLRAAERLALAGLAASALCRHAFIDAHLLGALDVADQVVILGAGYDARAYRFAGPIGGRPVFEVDLAPLSRRKAAVVAAHPDAFASASVRRVEIDFRRESLPDRLAAAGFEAGAPTFVAWEGVSMYLSRDAVDATLAAVAAVCGPGSVLAHDCWQQVAGVGGPVRPVAERAMRWIGEPVTFPLPSVRAPGLLRRHGFEVTDLATADELTARYANDGRRCDPGLYVVAAALG